MVFACILFIGNDAAEQISFAVAVLSIYNVSLAMLLPWRMFEINIVECLLLVLLVFVLIYTSNLAPEVMNATKIKSIVSTCLWIIICFSVFYIGRVCWGGV